MRVLIFMSVLLAGCDGTADCPDGATRAGDRCVPLDAGPSDSGRDTNAPDTGEDAGACSTACTGSTPHCDETSMTCVACLVDGHCAPEYCVDNACVACRTNADCPVGMPVCSPTSNTCVGCENPADCSGRTGTEVCDATDGACVECLASDRTACGTNVCNHAARTCTSTMERSANLCEECVADEHCQMDQLCVPMTFMTTDVGSYCLWKESAPAGPNGACANVPPYAGGEMMTSLDGEEARVCGLAVTTCVAVNQFRMLACTDGMLPDTTDEECGVSGVNDAYCRFSSGLGTNRCTIPCGSDDDCKTGFTCDLGATPQYCEL